MATKTKSAPKKPQVLNGPPPRDNLPAVVPPIQSDNPMALLLATVQRKDVDPETLRKVLDMAKEMKALEAAAAYDQDMALCQAEMPVLPRSEKGQNSKYCPYDVMDRRIRPIYTKYGFSLSFTEDPTKSNEHFFWYICFCSHRLGHTRKHEGLFPREGEGPRGGATSMNRVQAVGSNRSYGKRYLVKDVFGLSEAKEDTDGQQKGSGPREHEYEKATGRRLAFIEKAPSILDLEKYKTTYAADTKHSPEQIKRLDAAYDKRLKELQAEHEKRQNAATEAAPQ